MALGHPVSARHLRQASWGTGFRFVRSRGQLKIFFPQHCLGLDHFRMRDDAFDWTHFDTLRLIKMSDAFGAKFGIDFVEFDALVYRVIRTFRFANVAIDALIGDQQRHIYFLIFPCIFSTTSGLTNWLTSPPMVAISRTMLAETNI